MEEKESPLSPLVSQERASCPGTSSGPADAAPMATMTALPLWATPLTQDPNLQASTPCYFLCTTPHHRAGFHSMASSGALWSLSPLWCSSRWDVFTQHTCTCVFFALGAQRKERRTHQGYVLRSATSATGPGHE